MSEAVQGGGQVAQDSQMIASRRAKGSRFGLRFVLLAAVLGGLGLAHGAILRGAACALIAEREELVPDAIWLSGGDHRFQTAADIYHEDIRRRILIGRSFRDRVVQVGVLPPLEEVARKQLVDRGVPNKAVVFFGESCRDAWEMARALQLWLAENPETHVLFLCERVRSRERLTVLRQVLEPQEVARIGICGLPDYKYDETNWWKSRKGIKGFMNAWIGLVCASVFGEPAERPVPWDAETYERLVVERVEGKTR